MSQPVHPVTQQEPIRGVALALMTLVLSLGVFMNILDTSIANVAIPSIAGDLAVSTNQGTWVITSFAVSMAIMLPLTGWLAKRFGEVKLFVGSTILFSIASMLCGLATNLPMLTVFRVLQGFTAGPMIPLSQSLLLANYPPAKRGLATSLWAMTAVIAPICGPILGGWITDNFSWPWIFYINLPVGILSALGTWFFLADRETPTHKLPIDKLGLLLLVVGIGSLQILLDNGKDWDWFNSSMIIGLAVVSAVTLSFLVAWELTERHPIVDLSLFFRRNYSVGVVALSLGYMTFFANIVIFPLWLQTQMGYTATWAGLAAAPIGILTLFFSPLVGIWTNKVDLRILSSIGFIVFAFACFWAAKFSTAVGFQQLIVPRLIQGVGLSFFFVPLISIVISGLPTERIASALGLANFFRILGGSFGTSLSVTFWDHREIVHNSQLVETFNFLKPLAIQTIQHLNALGLTDLASLALVSKVTVNQAYMLASNDIFWASGWIFLSLLIVVWLARPPFAESSQGGAVD